jgi:hypothetical protein
MKFKIDIGARTEDEVQASVEGAFSPLFVFRAPRKEDQDEVTDVLVPWHDVGLVIQVKAQALDPSGQGSQKDPLSWVRKNLAKAGRQVAGAVRAIRDGRLAYVEPRCQRISVVTYTYPFLIGKAFLLSRHNSGASSRRDYDSCLSAFMPGAAQHSLAPDGRLRRLPVKRITLCVQRYHEDIRSLY